MPLSVRCVAVKRVRASACGPLTQGLAIIHVHTRFRVALAAYHVDDLSKCHLWLLHQLAVVN